MANRSKGIEGNKNCKTVPLNAARARKRTRPPPPKGRAASITPFPKGGRDGLVATAIGAQEQLSDISIALMKARRNHRPLATLLLLLTIAIIGIILMGWNHGKSKAITPFDMFTTSMIGNAKEHTLSTAKPDSRIHMVKAQTEGSLSQLLVHEGERVEQGQPLITLANNDFAKASNRSNIEHYRLLTAIARLQAQANDSELVFANPTGIEDVQSADIQRLELRRFRQERESLDTLLESANEAIRQGESAVGALESRRDHLQHSYDLGMKELSATRPLVAKGVVAKDELIELEQRVEKVYAELHESELNLPRLSMMLQEQRSHKQELDRMFREQARQELLDLEARLPQWHATNLSYQNQVETQAVRAPVAGTIQKIYVTHIGDAVKPDTDLIEIMPVKN